MPKINIADPEFSYDPDDPEGYRCGMARVGPELGAKRTGSSVYELPPGQALCPYHYEHGEEEWLLVVAGTPTLRTPEGESVLQPMDLAFFPTGPEGAHTIRNASSEPARILMYSEVVLPTVTVYPDSDKIAAWTGSKDDDTLSRRAEGLSYYDGEA